MRATAERVSWREYSGNKMNAEAFSPAVYQSLLLVKAMAVGLGIGIWLDFYRAARSIIKSSRRVTVMTDLIFWIAISVVSLAVLLVISWGEIYFYSYIGIIIGFLINYFLFSRFIFRFWAAILGYIFSAVSFVFRGCSKVARTCASILNPASKIIQSWKSVLSRRSPEDRNT